MLMAADDRVDQGQTNHVQPTAGHQPKSRRTERARALGERFVGNLKMKRPLENEKASAAAELMPLSRPSCWEEVSVRRQLGLLTHRGKS
jgi:hypothetical protein